MLYDTICELWPQYCGYARREIEQRFVVKYPLTMKSYKSVLALPRRGVDPLGLWKEDR